ncbi:hypothetical protein P7K49_033049 [Saguinus oedipus]|uniref:Uncharacterized protein n=1 Tax=Saguinus oedipus TaxID=9490 RepID=A0ABQ9TSH7_SAGOE|nr:hypothetical protein P7K49_033049 [Saguinus oedipus]
MSISGEEGTAGPQEGPRARCRCDDRNQHPGVIFQGWACLMTEPVAGLSLPPWTLQCDWPSPGFRVLSHVTTLGGGFQVSQVLHAPRSFTREQFPHPRPCHTPASAPTLRSQTIR